MMRKSTLFISAALTTFMLAVMFGVASAYQKIVQNGGVAKVDTQSSNSPAADAAVVSGFTPEQAAEVASTVIGRTDLYSAENSQLNGVDVYLVTFSSGDLVYVGLDGKVLSISKIPVKYVAGQSVWVGSNNNGGGSSASSGASVASSPSSSSAASSGNQSQSNEDDPAKTGDHQNEDHPVEEHDD